MIISNLIEYYFSILKLKLVFDLLPAIPLFILLLAFMWQTSVAYV